MYTNTDKTLAFIVKEYEKEKNKTNWSNAQDYLDEVLEGVNKLKDTALEQTEIIECCPDCGEEIHMYVRRGTEKINFCPYCGFQNVYLCSECMDEIGDCQPSASCAYCHGHCH